MSYTKAHDIAAGMLGIEWAGLLHSDLYSRIHRAQFYAGEDLDRQSVAVLVVAWEMSRDPYEN